MTLSCHGTKKRPWRVTHAVNPPRHNNMGRQTHSPATKVIERETGQLRFSALWPFSSETTAFCGNRSRWRARRFDTRNPFGCVGGQGSPLFLVAPPVAPRSQTPIASHAGQAGMGGSCRAEEGSALHLPTCFLLAGRALMKGGRKVVAVRTLRIRPGSAHGKDTVTKRCKRRLDPDKGSGTVSE